MTRGAILIVDDDQALLRALPEALQLRMNGVEIETSDSAAKALELISARDYDAIVTDIKMPGMDGLALLAEIGKIRPATPTLLITGHGERELTVQALRGGAYDFIQKPIERDYLVASLERAIEKRRLDRQIERQRLALERHARVLQHVGDGVFLVDPNGVIQLWNQAASAVTGLAAETVLGRRPDEVLRGWDQILPLIPVTPVPGTGDEGARSFPLEIGDRELWISIAGVEFAEGTVYAFRDLTSERAVADLKDEFVATVSHELRTPLASIYGAAETLRRPDRQLSADHRERLLRVIAEESERLARVVSDILLASHIDSGRLQLADKLVDPAELARSVIEAIGPGRDGVHVELVASPSLPALSGDADKLRQVLINLVDNAIKFSPKGGAVQVRIEAQGDSRLRFSVRDSGLGITAADQRRIFEKFYRADPNLTQGVGGTGLGLYIARELVRRMGGHIWVDSEHGSGSTFFVDLPCEPARTRELASTDA